VQFLLTILFQFYPCYYLALSFYSYTCWVPTISVLNLAIFPCYSNLLLKRRRWTGILRWGVLGYVLPRLPFLWSYGVFHCSVSLRVVTVFRDITYVIITLFVTFGYLWALLGRMCGTIDPMSCIRWVLSFGIKIGYDTSAHLAISLLMAPTQDRCRFLVLHSKENFSFDSITSPHVWIQYRDKVIGRPSQLWDRNLKPYKRSHPRPVIH
jgi:hypothetical protein